MHLFIALAVLLAAWRFGDWRSWKKYHSTMLYIAMCNLLYVFIYDDHFLWQFKPDILFNSTVVELLYTFFIFPATALLLLSNYPKNIKRQVIHLASFVIAYVLTEWIALLTGRIVHSYGWNMWWSLAWDSMMFPMWALHYKKPVVAYGFSILVIASTLLLFPISL